MAARRRRGEPARSPPRATCGRRIAPLPERSPAIGKPRSLEGFLFPATYDVYETDPPPTLVEKQLEDFRAEVGEGRARLRALEEPDALRRPDHRLDDREGGRRPARAPAVAAVIYNRLHAADAARDRRDAPLRPEQRAVAGVSISAVLERMTFANEETGYTIARVATARAAARSADGGGPLLGAQVGREPAADRALGLAPKYGRQFEVRVLHHRAAGHDPGHPPVPGLRADQGHRSEDGRADRRPLRRRHPGGHRRPRPSGWWRSRAWARSGPG